MMIWQKSKQFSFFMTVLTLTTQIACAQLDSSSSPVNGAIFAKGETVPVKDDQDAADDPAIWVHPQDKNQSRIYGSNKRGGVVVYNLQGEQLYQWEEDALNNIDIRYNFPYQGKKIDILVGSIKDNNSLMVFKIEEETGNLIPISKKIPVAPHKAYGFCLYQDLKTSQFYGFITSKNGKIEQWSLRDNGAGEVVGKKVRSLKLSSQTEGCVADDEFGYVYMAEEAYGVWKFEANEKGNNQGVLISSISENPNLVADLEGITLYQTTEGHGYLILSVQSKNEYAVFERQGNHRYLGNFSVVNNQDVDGISHTDGIDVISTSLGDDYPFGFFIAQDDENVSKNGEVENQNFKMVPWENIANSSWNRKLTIDEKWSPRRQQLLRLY